MICYKDKTWCDSDCTSTGCHRNMTPDEYDRAKAWWAHDPENVPIAYADFSADCDDYIAPGAPPTLD